MKVRKTVFNGKIILAFLSLLTSAFALQAQNMQDALNAIERNQFEKATNILQEVLKKEPGNASAYYHLGGIYLYNEADDSAKILFEKGIHINTNEPINYVGLGRYFLAQKLNADARAQFDKALNMGAGKNAFVMQQVASAYVDYVSTKDAALAVDLATKATNLDKKNLYYAITLGDALRLNGEGSKGIQQYKNAMAANAKFPLAPYRIGQLYLKVKTFTEAENFFNQTLAIDPNYAPVYADMGELYYQTGKVDKAIESYKKYLAMVGTSIPERLRYASFLYVNKAYKEALAELQTVAQKSPDNPLMLRLTAFSQYELEDYANGLTTMEKYFKVMEPKPEKIISKDYEYYGRLLSKNGKDELAIENLRKGISMDSTNVGLYDVIAESLVKQKKYAEAAEEIKTKMARSEEVNNQDYFTLGRYYYFAGNNQEADSAFAKVIEYYPSYAYGYLFRARANSKMDLTSEKGLAKPYYELFIEKTAEETDKYKKELAEAYYYLASYNYLVKKDMAQAKIFGEKVRSFDPNHEKNKVLLEEVNKAKK